MDLAIRTALNRLRILIPPSLRSTEDRVCTCMILANRRFLRPLCILAPPPRHVQTFSFHLTRNPSPSGANLIAAS